MTPGQLEDLRRQLPPFGSDIPLPKMFEDYCRYYSIDFARRNPAIEHTAGTIDSAGFRLSVQFWSQPGAVSNLFLLHGYFDHTGLFSKLIGWALDHGCNVLIFDLPGHGLSSGEPAVIDDFGDYARGIADVLSAVRRPALPLWAMGQSTGGAALVEFARSAAPADRWPFAATVLLAPLVRPARWWLMSAAHAVLRLAVDTVPRGFAANSSDLEFLAFVKADPLQSGRVSLRWLTALRRWLKGLDHRDLGVGPALLIQGEADHTVDWRYNVEVNLRLFPGSRVKYLPGAGHHLANESKAFLEEYLAEVVRWLGESGVALPVSSGVKTG